MSETNGKVVANIQKQLESVKVWANTSNSNPRDKKLKLLFYIQQKCMVINGCQVQWQFCLVCCMLGGDLNLGSGTYLVTT